MLKRFRPQDIDPRWRLRQNRIKNFANLSWQIQNRPYPVGWQINHRTIGAQFYRLHYLALHAPAPIRKRWSAAYKRFYNTKFGTRASTPYLNTWSCHNWI
jgi:hypothetical protein